MGRTLAAGRHYSRAEVLNAVASAHAAIEICVCRLQDFNAAPVLDRLADHIMNEALVLSAPGHDWLAEALPEIGLEVRFDGTSTYRGQGGHPLGDPVMPLVWMANHLSDRGITLATGHVITTGSCNGIHHVPAGTRVEVEFSGLGIARIQL
jgi:2-keto-4-pentenoate hydratase